MCRATGAALLLGLAVSSVGVAAQGPTESDWQTLTSQYAQQYTQGRYEQAADLARLAAETAARVFGPDDPRTAQTLNDLGHLYHQLREYQQAARLHAAALAIRQHRLGSEDAAVVQSEVNLAKADVELGRPEAALPLLEAALAVLEAHREASLRLADVLSCMARSHSLAGRDRQAEPLFQRAATLAMRSPRSSFLDVDRLIEEYAACLRRLGKIQQAEAITRGEIPFLNSTMTER